mgnify:CR=1 FL=1
MLPRCGRAAHICGANKTVWELQQKSKRELEESQLPSKQKVEMMEQGFRGNCDSKASWGCAPALPNRIQVVFLETCEILRCNCSPGTVARYLFADKVSQGGAILFAPPRKAVAFLTTPSVCQKHGTGISLPAGSDQGCSPTPRQHF